MPLQQTGSYVASLYTSSIIMVAALVIFCVIRRRYSSIEVRRNKSSISGRGISEKSWVWWVYESWKLDNVSFYEVCQGRVAVAA